MGRNRRRTSARPASQGDARPAFPHPHPQVIGAEQGRKFNIGALGEESVVFDGRAKSRKINRFCIGNKMHTMWVAHAHRCRLTGKRQVQCVNRRCQGHLAPHQLRRTHVHPNAAIHPFGPQMPAVCH